MHKEKENALKLEIKLLLSGILMKGDENNKNFVNLNNQKKIDLNN